VAPQRLLGLVQINYCKQRFLTRPTEILQTRPLVIEGARAALKMLQKHGAMERICPGNARALVRHRMDSAHTVRAFIARLPWGTEFLGRYTTPEWDSAFAANEMRSGRL